MLPRGLSPLALLPLRPLRLARAAANASLSACLIAGSIAGGLCVALPFASIAAVDEFNATPGEMLHRLPLTTARFVAVAIPAYALVAAFVTLTERLSLARHDPQRRQRLKVGLLAPVSAVLFLTLLAATLFIGNAASQSAYSPGSSPPAWLHPWAALGGVSCLAYPAALVAFSILLVHAMTDRTIEAELAAKRQCPMCGYDLSGLTTPVCPECGKLAPPRSIEGV